MDARAATTTGRTAVPRPRPGLRGRLWRHRSDYLYIAPALLVMLVVIAYPVYDTIYLSFFNTPPGAALSDKTFAGIDNYSRILGSAAFADVSVNTLIWTVFSTLFSFLLGLGAALALDSAFPGRALIRGVLLVPWVISAVSASYIWRWIYHSDFGVIGALGGVLGLTHGPVNLIDNTTTVLPALILVNVWKEFPFAMIMLLAGLQTVPATLHRAAQVDGAGAWGRFWHVTLPHLRGVATVTVLLLLVANLNSFIIPWIMTAGGPAGASDLWITAIYALAFERIRFGIASAYSVIVFLVMMVLGYFYVRALAARPDGGRR